MGETYIFAFSTRGMLLAERIANGLRLMDSQSWVTVSRPTHLWGELKEVFKNDNVVVFVGACGIAVRAIAPLISSKSTDPAVIVIDEKGEYVISLLSGHIGGANRFTRRIATILQAHPVITTATDVNGVFAFDSFASASRFEVINTALIKVVASAMLDGREVGLMSALPLEGRLPDLVSLRDFGDVGVYIGLDAKAQPFLDTLRLVPKCFHVGMGTRRGIDPDLLEGFFLSTLDSQGIPLEAVASVSSIDLKKDEQALRILARKYRIPFITYTAQELDTTQALFGQSDFVRTTTQTGNVCEAAAFLAASREGREGVMVVPKTIQKGMTIAIAKEERTVCFEIDDDGA